MFFLKRNLPTWERATRIVAGVAVGAAAANGLTTGIVTWLALAIMSSMLGMAGFWAIGAVTQALSDAAQTAAPMKRPMRPREITVFMLSSN